MAGQKKIAAQYGMKDDRVMALGFPLFSLHQNKPPAKQFTRKRVQYQPDGIEETVSYVVWSPPAQALSLKAPISQPVVRGRDGHVELARVVNLTMPKGFR